MTERHDYLANNTTYYTPQELADLWRCHRELVYDLLRSGRLKGFKLGRDWRISEEARLAYEKAPENGQQMFYSLGKKTIEAKPAMRIV